MKNLIQKCYTALTIILALALIGAIVYFIAFIWQPEQIKPALSAIGLESIIKKDDSNTPIELDESVAKFCKEASKQFSSGSHVIARKKDFESINTASKERIHWEIMKNLVERKNISVYGNDNMLASDIKDAGDIYVINASIKEMGGYRIFFTMEKLDKGAAGKIVLLRDYTLLADENLLYIEEQNKEEPEPSANADATKEAPTDPESARGEIMNE